jgi:hypothetical protein
MARACWLSPPPHALLLSAVLCEAQGRGPNVPRGGAVDLGRAGAWGPRSGWKTLVSELRSSSSAQVSASSW